MKVTVEVKAPIANTIGFSDVLVESAQFEWDVPDGATVGDVARKVAELSDARGKGEVDYVKRLLGDLSDVVIALDGRIVASESSMRSLHDGAKVTFLPIYVSG